MRLLLCLAALCFSTFPGAAQTDAPTSRILGFGNVDYLTSDESGPEGFTLGQLVGHLATSVGERVSVFTEVSLTPGSSAYTAEVERLILRYDFGDYFKLSAGRYHTPISYWNTAFHHGLWLQTSVGRPELTRFGSRLIPVHFVGLLAEGSLGTRRGIVMYSAGVGNGRGNNIARGGDAFDNNNHRAWLLGLAVRPDRPFRSQLGTSVYRDRIELGGASFNEYILSTHAVLEREHPEVLAEYVASFHAPSNGPGSWSTNHAFYVQVAYRLADKLSRLKPYARFERIRIAADDTVLSSFLVDTDGVVVGVRFDFMSMSALKLEYRNDDPANDKAQNSLIAQLSFVFHVD